MVRRRNEIESGLFSSVLNLDFDVLSCELVLTVVEVYRSEVGLVMSVFEGLSDRGDC